MRLLMILTMILLTSSCVTTDYKLADQCFGHEMVLVKLNVPPKPLATKEDYYEAARVRTEEALIFSRRYESARECIGEFK